MTFFNVNSAVLTSKWRGESEKLVTTLFNMARHYAPSIIFLVRTKRCDKARQEALPFLSLSLTLGLCSRLLLCQDEIDALLQSRGRSSEHEASRVFKCVMFSQIDGILSHPFSDASNANGLVLLLATSNCPWDLDQSIRRRLETRIYVPLPDAAAREEVLRLHLRGISLDDDVDLSALAERTAGYSGADLKVVCRDASMAPFRRLIADKTPEQIRQLGTADPAALQFRISQSEFLAAIQRVQPSVDSSSIRKFEEWQKEFGSSV